MVLSPTSKGRHLQVRMQRHCSLSHKHTHNHNTVHVHPHADCDLAAFATARAAVLADSMGGKGSCLGLTALGSATVCLEPDPDLGLSRLLCSLVALLKTVLVCHSDCHALQQQLSALPGSCS